MHDIRELLEIGKGQAPPSSYGADELIVAGRRRRRLAQVQRMGGVGVLAVGLATFGILAANTIALRGAPGTGQTVPRNEPTLPTIEIPPLTFMFEGYTAGAYRVLPPQVATTTYQEASIVKDYQDANGQAATAFVGFLTVYRPGVVPPAGYTSGTPVTVNGQPGFVQERSQDHITYFNGFSPSSQPAFMANILAWQYAEGGWAVINSIIEQPTDSVHRMAAADEQAIAEAFTLGTASPARIPFQAAYLPAGYEVVSIQGRSFGAEDVGMITVVFAPSSAAGTDKVRHFTDDGADGPAVVISIVYVASRPPDAPPPGSLPNPHCGHLDTDTDLYCSWDVPGTNRAYGAVMHDPANTMSQAELIQIGDSLTFDDLEQPDTWHPVS